MGLSFWLVPTRENESSILRSEMTRVRERCIDLGHKSSAPFSPHATLLAGIHTQEDEQGNHSSVRLRDTDHVWITMLEALDGWKRKRESHSSDALIVGLQQVEAKGKYFQCIPIELQETPELMSLNEAMRKAFGQDEGEFPRYYPHCSLFYGDCKRQEALNIVADLALERHTRRPDSSTGILFGSNEATAISSITFGAIELWDTNGPVELWHMVKRTMI